MMDWNLVRPVVAQVLRRQTYTNSGQYHGERCFISPYQIAVLVDRINPALKGSLPVGGEGTGPDSFARRIAWHLSDDYNQNAFNGSLEIQVFSCEGLDGNRKGFLFDGGNVPSPEEFSIFRLV